MASMRQSLGIMSRVTPRLCSACGVATAKGCYPHMQRMQGVLEQAQLQKGWAAARQVRHDRTHATAALRKGHGARGREGAAGVAVKAFEAPQELPAATDDRLLQAAEAGQLEQDSGAPAPGQAQGGAPAPGQAQGGAPAPGQAEGGAPAPGQGSPRGTAANEQSCRQEQDCSDLLQAARDGQLDLVQQLIASGVDVNATGRSGGPPLSNAAYKGHTEVVKALLEAGADVNKLTDDYATALWEAVLADHVDIIKLLLAAKADPNLYLVDKGVLSTATIVENVEVVQLLLDHGADPNRTVPEVDYPLVIAASKGNLDIVHTLVKAGANVNLVDEYGRTSLDHAIEENHPEVVEALRAIGAAEQQQDAGPGPRQARLAAARRQFCSCGSWDDSSRSAEAAGLLQQKQQAVGLLQQLLLRMQAELQTTRQERDDLRHQLLQRQNQ